MATAAFHCPHTSPVYSTPPPLGSAHHALADLLFCEDCDAVRCRYCVTVEVASYFCPNCLFEVPGASVRGEKNRCARNCFLCPCCTGVLGVVPSDPPAGLAPTSPEASMGQPPYYLSCHFCKWDSKQVGLTFEKPTGLSPQLQKKLDSSTLLACYDSVKDYLEPHLKAGQAGRNNTGTLSGTHSVSSNLAQSSSSKYGSIFGLSGRARPTNTNSGDTLKPFVSTPSCSSVKDLEEQKVDFLKTVKNADHVIDLNESWLQPWSNSISRNAMMPQRVPLRTKITKRCPQCSHILSKPDPKSSSIRFKIKLLASNYLPSIEVFKRSLTSSSRINKLGGGTTSGLRRTPRTALGGRLVNDLEDEPLRAGRSHSFELSFTNPLYEPIQVSLSFALVRPMSSSLSSSASSSAAAAVPEEMQDQQEMQQQRQQELQPPWTIGVAAPNFTISAFAESWEYEDDDAEGMSLDDDEGRRKSKKRLPMGVLEMKANRTKISLELSVSKEAQGQVMIPMLVSFTYRASDSAGSKPDKHVEEDLKTFSFWTMLRLGTIQSR